MAMETLGIIVNLPRKSVDIKDIVLKRGSILLIAAGAPSASVKKVHKQNLKNNIQVYGPGYFC